MLLRGDERVRVSLAVEVMQLSGTGALLVDPKFGDSLKCVDASLNERPAGKRQLMVALAKRLREANLVLEAARLLYEARAPPPPADGSGVGALDGIAKEASASLAEMLLESIADGVVATQGGGAGGAAVAAVPEAAAAAAAAAERTAQMCNDAALFLREWERSDPHEAKAGVGAALRTLLVSHEFLAMLRAIGAGDTRTLEALGRLDFLPPNPAAVEEHRAAFRGLGVPVFALHRALPFVLEGAMRVLHAHYGALKAAADWPRLPELRERAEALMGFAGASSALGMHYGSTGDSNRKMVQMLADMA